jgi:predicted nucleotidyltransferase
MSRVVDAGTLGGQIGDKRSRNRVRDGGPQVLTDAELAHVLPVALEALRELLRRHYVVAAYPFGSRSRGSHRPDSDIDLLCVLDSRHRTITTLVDLQEAVEQLSPVSVDLATDINGALKQYVASDLAKVL